MLAQIVDIELETFSGAEKSLCLVLVTKLDFIGQCLLEMLNTRCRSKGRRFFQWSLVCRYHIFGSAIQVLKILKKPFLEGRGCVLEDKTEIDLHPDFKC